VIGDLRNQQIGSSSHLEQPIAEAGECVTRGARLSAESAVLPIGVVRLILDLRIRIGDLRNQQIGSSSHPEQPIAEAGECVTRGG